MLRVVDNVENIFVMHYFLFRFDAVIKYKISNFWQETDEDKRGAGLWFYPRPRQNKLNIFDVIIMVYEYINISYVFNLILLSKSKNTESKTDLKFSA